MIKVKIHVIEYADLLHNLFTSSLKGIFIMDNIKRGFVLVFALSLSFVPLAICWYFPLHTEFYQLAIFYYVFQVSPTKEIRSGGKIISFDSESIMKNEMLLMKVMGVIYVVVIVLFLIELLIQIIKRRNLEKVIKFTSILFLAVTIIQFVNSVLYRQMYEVVVNIGDETEWKCMWELNLTELLIAIGICTNLYKKKHRKIENSRQILWGHAIYSILLLISVQSCCFYCARYGIVAERGDYLYDYTIFLEDVLFYRIIYVCIFLNQTWLMIPDLPVIIFLSWGSYRLLRKLPEKKEVNCKQDE